MRRGPVSPAKWLRRNLDEPHETDLGGQTRHHQFCMAFVLMVCDRKDLNGRCQLRGGSVIEEGDLYDYADQYPLPWKADWFLESNGDPSPIPAHLDAAERQFVVDAQAAAQWVRAEAHRRGVID